MKPLPILLLFAAAVSAQSYSVECASRDASGASPTAGARPVQPPAKAEGDANRQAAANVAAQIQLNRGAPPRPGPSCRCGAVDASSLIAKAVSQEIPILSLAGNFRFDHVMLRETAKFTSNSVVSLAVGVGRANLGADIIPPIPLMSAYAPNTYALDRPGPPQLTGSYDLVLFFKAPAALGDGAVSNFASGTVTWEICGYSIPRGTTR